jgi:hypothetical protein
MPLVRSILSRGPWATSLPRETTTWSPISTLLVLPSKIAHSPAAVDSGQPALSAVGGNDLVGVLALAVAAIELRCPADGRAGRALLGLDTNEKSFIALSRFAVPGLHSCSVPSRTAAPRGRRPPRRLLLHRGRKHGDAERLRIHAWQAV